MAEANPKKKVVKKAKPKVEKKKVGAPKKYTDAFLKKEAEALDEWATREDTSHLAEFAIERGVSSVRLNEWRKVSEHFSEALIRAKDQLNIKVREKLNNPDKHYNERLAMRDISNYDALLKVEERDDKKFEADLKIQQDKAAAHTLAELNQLSANGDLSQK